MATAPMMDVQLLTALLSAPPKSGTINGASLLQHLLESAPRLIRPARQSTLFEAIEVLDKECPHSDFIAWLLDPLGPLSDHWLLRAILERVAPDRPWPGDPIVEREVPVSNGRLDIRVNWGGYQLIIENKIWSREGIEQIPRYLPELPTIDDGRLIYLSPSGQRPTSIDVKEERVVAMSYDDLTSLIEQGVRNETNVRGRVLADEFCLCVKRLINTRYDMNKPTISESTIIVLKNADRLAEIKALAITESADYLKWMTAEMERRLRVKTILGPEMVTHRGRYVVVFRLPNWVVKNVQFGIMFCWNCDPTKRLLTADDGPYLGIGCWSLDDDESKKSREEMDEVSEKLNPLLKKCWSHHEDMDDPDYTMPLWRDVPLPTNEDWDAWAEQTIKLCEDIATATLPILNQFASRNSMA